MPGKAGAPFLHRAAREGLPGGWERARGPCLLWVPHSPACTRTPPRLWEPEDKQRVPVPLHTLGSRPLPPNSPPQLQLIQITLDPTGFSDSQPGGSHLNALSFLVISWSPALSPPRLLKLGPPTGLYPGPPNPASLPGHIVRCRQGATAGFPFDFFAT